VVDRLDHVAGVLLFVNRKSERSAVIRNKSDADRYVLPYTFREVQVARALASQAAISIENAKLYAQIENILDNFVKASAVAIDQRDPTTAGHSVRVAALTTDLAGAVERDGRGVYRNVRFTRQQMHGDRIARKRIDGKHIEALRRLALHGQASVPSGMSICASLSRR